MADIKFRKHGRVFVPVFIKPQNEITMQPVSFKVDTGADTTAISKLSLAKLGYDMSWLRQNAVVFKDSEKPTMASGEKVNAAYIQLPLINILGYEGRHWPFHIIIDEHMDFRNLLGRDLLSGFNYQFNNDSRMFSISMAKAFLPLYDFLPKQEIHELLFE